MTESWRTEAWCPKHSRLEHINEVRSFSALSSILRTDAIEARVTLACGEKVSIVTTARNLEAMKA